MPEYKIYFIYSYVFKHPSNFLDKFYISFIILLSLYTFLKISSWVCKTIIFFLNLNVLWFILAKFSHHFFCSYFSIFLSDIIHEDSSVSIVNYAQNYFSCITVVNLYDWLKISEKSRWKTVAEEYQNRKYRQESVSYIIMKKKKKYVRIRINYE